MRGELENVDRVGKTVLTRAACVGPIAALIADGPTHGSDLLTEEVPGRRLHLAFKPSVERRDHIAVYGYRREHFHTTDPLYRNGGRRSASADADRRVDRYFGDDWREQLDTSRTRCEHLFGAPRDRRLRRLFDGSRRL
jgi:hypothetical protein